MQTAKLGIQPGRTVKMDTTRQNKMAINRIQEDLPKNQAQEGARKQLSSSEKDLKKYREIILQGCLIAKTKRNRVTKR